MSVILFIILMVIASFFNAWAVNLSFVAHLLEGKKLWLNHLYAYILFNLAVLTMVGAVYVIGWV
jgi:hypothetical protein